MQIPDAMQDGIDTQANADDSVPRAETSVRRRYEPPRIERRIPVAANTLQPTSGSQSVFAEE